MNLFKKKLPDGSLTTGVIDSASAMVRKLSLPTLTERREIARLKFLHNIYHGKKCIPHLIPVKSRSQNLRFKQIHGRVQT